MRHLLLALVATSALPVALAQQTLVAPAGHANTEGNTNNFWPWNLYPPAPSIRVQQLYDSSNFTTQTVAGPIRITRLRYRAEGGAGAWAGGTWPSVQIDMSTAAVDFLAPSSTYAQNHGPDLTTVLAGTVTVQGGTASTPGPWYVDIVLSTPFVYDPASGSDLVVDIRISGALIGTSFGVDHASNGGGLPPRGTRLLNSTSSGAATTGTVDLNYSPITEFTYEALASYVTFGPGCAGSAGIPGNQATALPVLGQTMIVVIGNLPAPEIAALFFGFSNTTSPFGPLPLHLAPIGAPNCFLRVTLDWPITLVGAGGAASFALSIPNSPIYLGARFYSQALALDAAANAFGATMSDAAAMTFGL